MAAQKIDSQLIRHWVYQTLQKPLQTHTAQLEQVMLSVYGQAVKEGYAQPRLIAPGIPDLTSLVNIPEELQNSVREVIWSLIIQGAIVPGVPNSFGTSGSGLPFFTVTEWGKECFKTGEYVPFDSAQYIKRLKSEIPTIDSDTVLYIRESLDGFRAGTYLSCAIMTGVASEKTLLVLRSEVEAAMAASQRKQQFARDTKDRPIKRVYDEIWKRLDPVHEELAKALGKEDVRAELSGIFDLIRKTRNDAGHPTGRSISRDEAHALLLLFPMYCKNAYETMGWLKSNPLP
jgi:hypothetical protein